MDEKEDKKPRRLRLTVYTKDSVFTFATRSDRLSNLSDGSLHLLDTATQEDVTIPVRSLLWYAVKDYGEV